MSTNKIIDFIKLVRYKNLVIIILVQSATKFFLINPYVKDPTLSNLEFIIFSIKKLGTLYLQVADKN